MKSKGEDALRVVTENVAMPEIRIGEAVDAPDEADSTEEIDYSGAIPQIHLGKQPENEEK